MSDPLLDAAASRIGRTLCKKYRLDALLGVGGMAAVYKGRHRNGNRVAVKMLHPQLSLSSDISARFLKEGYVANTVEHPGAVRVLDDDTAEDGSAFLVMELLEGDTVASRLEAAGGRLPAREVAEIAHRLLDILVAAHAKGIVHRDIKPENLFVTRDGQVKILDFGIARVADAAGGPSATRTGSTLGTPAFMAPEQALGLNRDVDGRTDLWAVGATMFTLLSGRYVHEAETVPQMMIFAGTKPAVPLGSVAPNIPAPIAAVVDRALAFEKASRFDDARAMQSALADAFRATFGERISAPGSPPTASAPSIDMRGATAPLTASAPGSSREPAPQAPARSGPVSTTAGLERTSTVPAGVPGRRNGAVLVALLLAGLAAVGATTFALIRRGDSDSPRAGGAGIVGSAAATPPPAIASAGSPAPSSSPSPSPPAETAKEDGRTPPAVAPSVAPATAPPQPRPVVVAPRPTATTSAAPGAPTQTTTKSCDPPFYIDPSTGTRKVKPGC